ncbi:MAG: TlpA disulfide reductase family protein [Candidatus Rokuibacteriota bacterium]
MTGRVCVAVVGLAISLGAAVATEREGHGSDTAESAPEVGRLAPDFALRDLRGRAVRLAHFKGRTAVVINFWATWCLPCRDELPTLEWLARARAETLTVLGVSLDTVAAAKVRAFATELGVTFPILRDPDFGSARLYRVRGLPASFVIDRSGVVRHRELGYRDWTTRESQVLLDEILRSR